MVKLFLGKPVALAYTVLMLGMIAFVVLSFVKRENVAYWGRRILLLVFWGLLLCVVASTRDGYHLSVQNAIDGSVAPGLFPAIGIQTILGGILAAVAVLCAIASIFVRNQDVREVLFFIIAGSLTVKILFMEISRIGIYLSGSSAWNF